MDLELQNKVALVTAASSGLGLATAMQLLNEGAKVAVCSRSKNRLQQAYQDQLENNGQNIALFETNLTSETDVNKLIADVTLHFGGLDILITNISGPPLTFFEKAQKEDWQNAHDSIVNSCIHLIHASLPFLYKSTSPSILTITSVAAKQYMPGLLLSNVYRPAIIGLTKVLSVELGEKGIRVNSILPGYTMTDRLKSALEYKANKNHTSLQQEEIILAKSVPLGRIGTPDEFAKAATFLVSPAASYISGVMLQVDGGFTESLF